MIVVFCVVRGFKETAKPPRSPPKAILLLSNNVAVGRYEVWYVCMDFKCSFKMFYTFNYLFLLTYILLLATLTLSK